VVPIFTYRDERKLFAIIGAVIVAALIALLQISYLRQGRPSPLTVAVTSTSAYLQLAVATATNAVRSGVTTVVDTPQLATENARLKTENAALQANNLALTHAIGDPPINHRAFFTVPAQGPGMALRVRRGTLDGIILRGA